jgi:hypothetical protein
MYYHMKLPYFGLNVRLLFTDLFRIRIRIRIKNIYFGSGSGQKFRILPDLVSDPQHWFLFVIFYYYYFAAVRKGKGHGRGDRTEGERKFRCFLC